MRQARFAGADCQNAKYLQEVAWQIMPKREPPEGFASIIPYQLLSQLHIPTRRLHIDVDPQLGALLKTLNLSLSGNIAVDPLFNGTIHFVRLKLTIQNQNNAVITSQCCRHGHRSKLRHPGSTPHRCVRYAIRAEQCNR